MYDNIHMQSVSASKMHKKVSSPPFVLLSSLSHQPFLDLLVHSLDMQDPALP